MLLRHAPRADRLNDLVDARSTRRQPEYAVEGEILPAIARRSRQREIAPRREIRFVATLV